MLLMMALKQLGISAEFTFGSPLLEYASPKPTTLLPLTHENDIAPKASLSSFTSGSGNSLDNPQLRIIKRVS